MQNQKLPKNLKLGIWSASICLLGAFLLYLCFIKLDGAITTETPNYIVVAFTILRIISIILPVVGLILGIVGLKVKGERFWLGTVLNVIAVVIPSIVLFLGLFYTALVIAIVAFM